MYDCLWHDSFPIIRRSLKERGISFGQIIALIVSHFHPDHAGSCELIRRHGVELLVMQEQVQSIPWLNDFYSQPKNDPAALYTPLCVADLKTYTIAAAEDYIRSRGFEGSIIHTLGHSEDGISLIVQRTAFVGDLPPFINGLRSDDIGDTDGFDVRESYGSAVARSWKKIINRGVKEYYHAHAGYHKLRVADANEDSVTD
jgi:glyoxylase-like metal-dependent hydrolase (beta-lactamase superfamily II)